MVDCNERKYKYFCCYTRYSLGRANASWRGEFMQTFAAENCYFIPLARAVLFFRNLPQLITRTMLQADHYFTPTLQGQAMVVTMVKRTFPNVTRKYSIFLKSIIYAGFFFFSGSWFFRTRIHQFSVLLFPYQAVYGSNEKILALLQLLERQCAINGWRSGILDINTKHVHSWIEPRRRRTFPKSQEAKLSDFVMNNLCK